MSSQDVVDQLFSLFILRGIPEYIRSDNSTGREDTDRELVGGIQSHSTAQLSGLSTSNSRGY